MLSSGQAFDIDSGFEWSKLLSQAKPQSFCAQNGYNLTPRILWISPDISWLTARLPIFTTGAIWGKFLNLFFAYAYLSVR